MIKEKIQKEKSLQNLQFTSDLHEESHHKKKRSKQKGHNGWSLEENLRYSTFLLQTVDKFQNQFVRRSQKVFRKISSILFNRTPEQCRSHHQKMIKSYKSIAGIHEHFRKLSAKKEAPEENKIVSEVEVKIQEEISEENDCEVEKLQKQAQEDMKDFDGGSTVKSQPVEQIGSVQNKNWLWTDVLDL